MPSIMASPPNVNRETFGTIFSGLFQRFIMEHLRRGENRKGQPHDNGPGRTVKKEDDQALKGFEGMNYEQKRKPYNEIGRSDKDWNRNSDDDIKPVRRRDDL